MLKITISKAAKIRNKLGDALDEQAHLLRSNAVVNVSAIDPAWQDKLTAAAEEVKTNVTAYFKLLELYGDIRDKIQVSNVDAGINSLLLRLAMLKKMKATITTLCELNTGYNSTVSAKTFSENARITALAVEHAELAKSVSLSKARVVALSEEDIEKLKEDLYSCAAEITKVEDELAKLNSSQDYLIELSTKDMELLKTHRIAV